MKRFTVILFLFVLALVACGPGAKKESDAFVSARDDVMSAWAKEVDSNPTEAGIDNMRSVFESKKADLLAKKEAFMKAAETARGNPWDRVSDTNSMERTILDAMGHKFPDYSVWKKFAALRKDYEDAVKIPNLI